MLIKELEAAALYTTHSLSFTLNVGDVCDTSGGTVDLIWYEVVAAKPRSDCVSWCLGLVVWQGRWVSIIDSPRPLGCVIGNDEFERIRNTKGFQAPKELLNGTSRDSSPEIWTTTTLLIFHGQS